MGLLQSIEFRLRQYERLTALAGQIAESSFDGVWKRVQGRIYALQPAEARGYVRARARVVIERAVADNAADLGMSARSRLHVLALDATIRRVTTHVHAAWVRDSQRRAA